MKHLRQRWTGYLLFDAAFRPSFVARLRLSPRLGRIFFKKQTSNQLDAQLVIAICVFDLVHCPKGIFDLFPAVFINDDHILILIQIMVYGENSKDFGPVACPGVAVLIFVVHFRFTAFRVGGHDLIDLFTKFTVRFLNDLRNGDAAGIPGFVGKENPHR